MMKKIYFASFVALIAVFAFGVPEVLADGCYWLPSAAGGDGGEYVCTYNYGTVQYVWTYPDGLDGDATSMGTFHCENGARDRCELQSYIWFDESDDGQLD